jgi:hypothetical protein
MVAMKHDRPRWWVLVAVATVVAGCVLVAHNANARPSSVAGTHRSLTALDTATPTGTPVCGLAWDVVNSPNVGVGNNRLNAVKAMSADHVWAVGSYDSSGTSRTLVQHWHGSGWTVVPSPNVGTGSNTLTGLALMMEDDTWAVGHYFDGTTERTLIEHWDGAQWSVIPSPNVSGVGNYLTGVSATAANDAWAVGYTCTASCGTSSLAQTLTMHWNDIAWSIVASPNMGTGDNNWLYDVAEISTNDAWAVGYYNSCYGCVTQTLMIHWNGSAWSIVATPNRGFSSNMPNRLAALSSNDVWAAGSYYTGDTLQWRTLTLHWDGTQWSAVNSYNHGSGHNFLSGVTALAPDDVWAAGNWYNGNEYGTLLIHWDGSFWTYVSSPNAPGSTNNYLADVAADAPDDVWAAGYAESANPARTLALRYSDPCGGPTATATVMPTLTPTPTETPAGTPCIVQSTPYTEGFESGTLHSFTSQVAQCSTGGCGWSAVTTGAHSGTYSAFAPNIQSISDQRMILTTPVVVAPDASAATLSFWHKHVFDQDAGNYYDGSVLELSTNGGVTWTDVLSSTNFIAGGYDGVIVFGHFNPLARRQAWGGYNAAYPNFQKVVVNLLPLAGRVLLLRFRIGTDHVVGAQGWWIDDIRVDVTEPCPTSVIAAHVTWQGPPGQPSARQQLPITLTLKLGTMEANYPSYTTDASGVFTVPVGNLPAGTYQWRAKGPIYLANAGTVAIGGLQIADYKSKIGTHQSSIGLEMGTLRAGDCDNNNIVNILDFNVVKTTFGKANGDLGYDARADFNNDTSVNVADVNLQKINYGFGGAPPVGP